jgi:hypothetical protein
VEFKSLFSPSDDASTRQPPDSCSTPDRAATCANECCYLNTPGAHSLRAGTKICRNKSARQSVDRTSAALSIVAISQGIRYANSCAEQTIRDQPVSRIERPEGPKKKEWVGIGFIIANCCEVGESIPHPNGAVRTMNC